MVSARKWMLAASRISDASARVIQSDGATNGQSPALAEPDERSEAFLDVDAFSPPAEAEAAASADDDDDRSPEDPEDPPDPPEPPSLLEDAEPPSALVEAEPPSLVDPLVVSPLLDGEPSSLRAFAEPAPAVARRSFLAQPVPLKWIAGVENAFFTGPPPHNGQLAGGSACTPRRISNRLPQFAQS